ncbi:MAG: YabP/YqfC family sporulation protein [Clostridia bacterium]|nr:YabP/YqfC family sporulation protein [Clostridia bacterium]MBQ8511152.1 YabP/YqfC family sporulation protein [Clostridia bacterium]
MHDGITKKLSELMALPVDVLSSMPVTVIRGREELEVEGCTGILEYEPCRVVLSMKEERLTVRGRCLMLSDFTGRTLTVRGCIASVVFGEDGE